MMNPQHYTDFDHGITAIDTGYVRPNFDASHLIVRDGRAAFVDTGTSLSLDRLLDGLERANVTPADVEYVFITHVHLDHAGGAGALMQRLPNARCVVHPRGARHLVDPGKLIAGTIAVYGEAEYKRLYGEIVPIPVERVVESEDRACFNFGDSAFELIDTPGHALHHYSIVDPTSNSIFSGDTFGVSYRIFDTVNGAFVMPATTPTHFDPAQAHASVDRLMSYAPQAMFLTHYSRVTDLRRLAADMHLGIDQYVDIARTCAGADNRELCMKEKMHDWLCERLAVHGCELPDETRDLWLAMDIDLNVQGLAVWLDRTGD
ncbi:MAG TPA: MBL fold metallo-hydrolase [Gammaproteobacteria bacterium]|nr:MBL fold metallo-hydrolase [Gammaproteobacteria bacterium]